MGLLQEALELAETFAPLEERLKQAQREGLITAGYLGHQIDQAETAEILSKDDAANMRDYLAKVEALLAVDDFAPGEFIGQRPAPGTGEMAANDDAKPAARAAARKKATGRKKTKAAKKPTRKKASKKTSQSSAE